MPINAKRASRSREVLGLPDRHPTRPHPEPDIRFRPNSEKSGAPYLCPLDVDLDLDLDLDLDVDTD